MLGDNDSKKNKLSKVRARLQAYLSHQKNTMYPQLVLEKKIEETPRLEYL